MCPAQRTTSERIASAAERPGGASRMDAKFLALQGARDARTTSPASESSTPSRSRRKSPETTPTSAVTPRTSGGEKKPLSRSQKAAKIIDEVLDAGEEKQQTRVALEVLKMDREADPDKPKAFGQVLIQGKLSLEEWDEMRERMRSVGK